ncbi:hypothetical protein A0J61_04752 [Choanephora cucurbitarum]|uniref:Uncharacterized protein n=1 Tax=Choanephora cucurbitarum TaxID=101091 RepID=A0A1C7NDM4_9FUNG|nr:hypothetical protein A0J61_04752 [Choanephora cucurbitarum]
MYRSQKVDRTMSATALVSGSFILVSNYQHYLAYIPEMLRFAYYNKRAQLSGKSFFMYLYHKNRHLSPKLFVIIDLH